MGADRGLYEDQVPPHAPGVAGNEPDEVDVIDHGVAADGHVAEPVVEPAPVEVEPVAEPVEVAPEAPEPVVEPAPVEVEPVAEPVEVAPEAPEPDAAA